jgi:hypothetical protein
MSSISYISGKGESQEEDDCCTSPDFLILSTARLKMTVGELGEKSSVPTLTAMTKKSVPPRTTTQLWTVFWPTRTTDGRSRREKGWMDQQRLPLLLPFVPLPKDLLSKIRDIR